MAADLKSRIASVINRAPAWLRQDLSSSDAGARARAEETLAAMIVEAVERQDGRAA